MSKIEWTEKTWNPIVGCSVTSPGCTNCYAMRMAARIERMGTAPHYDGTTKSSKGGPVWTGKLALAPDSVLLKPLKRKIPTIYFVNSMGDLFHENVPDDWIDQVFAIMALCPQHTFQILTKHSSRMRKYMRNLTPRKVNAVCAWTGSGYRDDDREIVWPLPNVWLGVSAEDQTRWDERTPDLGQTPAAVRFVSAEPLLGPIDRDAPFAGAKVDMLRGAQPAIAPLDWVIVGGESGKDARPMHPDWARGLRDQCLSSNTSFFFKQWGEWAPHENETAPYRVGKKAAGRLLDGQEWNEAPK